MSRDSSSGSANLLGFPRVSGDEPFRAVVVLVVDAFSPREWG